ncbi:MAG: Ku protein [Solirubrobacterales bacterium]
MPAHMWKGSIGFGLVNVPVRMTNAIRDLNYHFHELHAKDGARIHHKRFCTEDGEEVSGDEIGRGIEVDGEMVVLTKKELEDVQPERSRTIEIESFTELDSIDPIHFDQSYYLVPADDSVGTLRAYELLVKSIGESNQVAIGRFVMHTREYLAAVREREGALALSTMKFPDEIRSVDAVPAADFEPDTAAIDDAISIIRERSVDWDPGSHTDCYHERLARVIDSKAKGKTISAPDPVADDDLTPAPDLMAALRKTLAKNAGGKKSGKRTAPARTRPKDALGGLSRSRLYELAKERDIPGRSTMNKSQLAEALKDE